MYGAHKISNLEDLRKNERNQSEDAVTATIDPACEAVRTRGSSNLRVTNIYDGKILVDFPAIP